MPACVPYTEQLQTHRERETELERWYLPFTPSPDTVQVTSQSLKAILFVVLQSQD